MNEKELFEDWKGKNNGTRHFFCVNHHSYMATHAYALCCGEVVGTNDDLSSEEAYKNLPSGFVLTFNEVDKRWRVKQENSSTFLFAARGFKTLRELLNSFWISPGREFWASDKKQIFSSNTLPKQTTHLYATLAINRADSQWYRIVSGRECWYYHPIDRLEALSLIEKGHAGIHEIEPQDFNHLLQKVK